MEDNITVEDTFAPSIFDTARELIVEGKSASAPSSSQPESTTVEIDLDTSKILVEIPFDIAGQILKSNDIALTKDQTEKLGKLWRAPLQRILAKYEDSDIIVAAAATLSIAGGKYLDYKLEQSRRNGTGDEGKRQDQLREKQVT